jgi:hypothetical protein
MAASLSILLQWLNCALRRSMAAHSGKGVRT